MNIELAILDGPLPDASPLWEPRQDQAAGAIVRFDGVVRAEEAGRPIEALDYQAYEPMASSELHALAGKTVERFGLRRLAVAHSRGRVPVGRCSFRLMVASPHRAESLAAVAWFIEGLKRDVPIWKRPVFPPDKVAVTSDASPGALPTASLNRIVEAWCESIVPLPAEGVPWQEAVGRVLAEPIVTDRPSPACDISAMDGYALRAADRDGCGGVWSVAFEVQAGRPAPELPKTPATGPAGQPQGAAAPQARGGALAARVFTGAMVPAGADAVVPREQVREAPERIELPGDVALAAGQHIRRAGENAPAGRVIARPGRPLSPALLGAAAACGLAQVRVVRRVRVGVVVTGDEVLQPHQSPAPWQLRDGNGPALLALLRTAAWLDPLPPVYAPDQPDRLAEVLRRTLDACDALLVTGGVSAGDYDHVAPALRALGVRIAFHKLPIRPGKPILAGTASGGRPVLGLPGNPVSALVTAVRFAGPALRRRAGLGSEPLSDAPAATVQARGDARAPASLTWFPLVRLAGDGTATVAPGMGSGDWVAAAQSDGFIEVPPGETVRGARRLYRWSLDPVAPAAAGDPEVQP